MKPLDRRATLVACLALLPMVLLPLALAPAPAEGAGGDAQAAHVTVGMYVVGFGNFDPNKGTYNLDFYIWFRWDTNDTTSDTTSDTTLDPLSFEFMNGRAGSRDKLSDETDAGTGVREVWYRVNAALFHEPDFSTYPFNKQELTIVIEDTKLPAGTLAYATEREGSGYDPDVKISGWRIEGWDIGTGEKSYPWGETYSRLTFTIHIGRPTTTTAIKTLLPPIIFCFVSGLSFAFRPDKIANRIGFGTSMLISAVMFHISQTASLPPMPTLMTIDKIMIATYAFLAASMLVTTVIYIDEEFWKDKDYTKQVNYYGAILAILLPFIVYGVLAL
jgi:hypothetical protein